MSQYRYGFNGKENDNEVKGEGNQQDYGFRIYDPRIGKFLSVDPITAQYPELTPYQFASNRPIDGIDLDGLEHSSAGKESGRDNTAVMKLPMAADIMVKSIGEARAAAMQQQRTNDAAAAAQRAQDSEASVGTKPPFVGTGLQKGLNEWYRKVRLAEAGYDGEGGKLWTRRLSENKTWQNLNDNIVEPMAEMAVADGAGRFVIGTLVKPGMTAVGAVWAQKTFGQSFSVEGKFAGQSVDNVITALKSGKLTPEDVPIDIVSRNGVKYILNTRSSAALTEAGIPREQWKVINRTGKKGFEDMLTGQLKRNNLGSSGTNTIRQSGTDRTITYDKPKTN